MESTYWLVGVKFKYNKTCYGRTTIENDERTWTVWANSLASARALSLEQWPSRKPKTFIEGTEKWLPSRKLTPAEIKKMESVFKK